MSKKRYIVKKYVVEEFEVMADSRKEAVDTNMEDPSIVRVVKITAKRKEI